MTDTAVPTSRVLVLAGPSGAGKSRLARRLSRRFGWPVVALDDFYADRDEPGLPMSPLGLPDWDHVGTWHADQALAALTELGRTGSADVPIYDISTSRVVGEHRLETAGSPIVIAEGIFAADIVRLLRAADLLAAAWCIRNRPWLTFSRRLLRDLGEQRKPPLTLWRRGQILRRAEPGIVQAHQALGASPLTARQAERLAPLLAGEPVTSREGGGHGDR